MGWFICPLGLEIQRAVQLEKLIVSVFPLFVVKNTSFEAQSDAELNRAEPRHLSHSKGPGNKRRLWEAAIMASNFSNLMSPLQMGDLKLKNRVVMASLTRNRDNVPRENLHAPYYAERAGTGLIVRISVLHFE